MNEYSTFYPSILLNSKLRTFLHFITKGKATELPSCMISAIFLTAESAENRRILDY